MSQDNYTQEVDDALADIDDICNESQQTAEIPPTENTDHESAASAAQDFDSMSIDEIEVELREKYSVRDFQYVYNTLKKDPDGGVEILLNISDSSKADAMKPILYRLRALLTGDSSTVSEPSGGTIMPPSQKESPENHDFESDSVAVRSMEGKTLATVIKSTLRNIPAEIQSLNQFTCRGGDDGKTPINPRTGYPAKWKLNNEIFPFAECVEPVEKGKYEGVSFLILRDNSILVIDLDHVVTNGEIIDRKAQQIVNFFKGKAYIELSKSKTGLHIFTRYSGDLPQWIFTNGKMKSFNGDNDIKYEFFIDDHLISPTGNIFDNHSMLGTIDTGELAQFLRQVFCDEYTRFIMLQFRSQGKLQLPTAGVEIDPNISFDIPPDELLEAAFQDPQFAEFAHVYQTGDSSIMGGRSERDFRIIRQLITMTNGDLGAVEYLFKRSACYTNAGQKNDPNPCAGIGRKGKEKDQESYLTRTIDKAIDRWNGKSFVPKSIWLKYIAPSLKKQGKSRDNLDLSGYNATEFANSKLIRQEFPDLISTVVGDSERSNLYNWNGYVFERVFKQKLIEKINKIGEKLSIIAGHSDESFAKILSSGAKKIEAKGSSIASLDLAVSGDRFHTTDEFNTAKDWFSFSNCYINTNPFSKDFLQIIAPDKSMLFTLSSSVAYKPNAKCPIFRKALKRMLPNDQTRREFIKAMALNLISGNPGQRFYFIYGLGANGKSTIATAIFKVLGKFAQSLKANVFRFNPNKDGSAPSPEWIQTRNKRAIWFDEISPAFIWDIERIKKIAAGGFDNDRLLFSNDMIDFKFECTPWAILNERINLSNVNDDALRRRIEVFYCGEKIPEGERDDSFEQKLESQSEQEGIVAMLIEEGLVNLFIDGGITPSPEMKAWKDILLENEGDFTDKFYDEVLEFDERASISLKALVAVVKAWGKDLPGSDEVKKVLENLSDRKIKDSIRRYFDSRHHDRHRVYTRGDCGERFQALGVNPEHANLKDIADEIEKALKKKQSKKNRQRYESSKQTDLNLDS